MKVLILYYSMYGNNFIMAQAVAEGVTEEGGEPMLRTVPELIPAEVIERDERLKKAKDMQKDVPIATQDDLIACDGLILGSPTRFGNMCAQMRNFWDLTSQIWLKGQLIGKPAGLFTSTASIHGGQETTLISMMFTLIHHGMIIVGVPYSVEELLTTERGGTPYGASAVVGAMADQLPTEVDLKIGRILGKRVTEITGKLKG
ncbi:MAG: NAD(P)H:quinone oxidoreductase [Proteobacteria bacterium]|nr:NAD(P)H:quinone oxidoreductase [Pseudomonadota bacterium]NIS68967.1 NAD(P)H:quinone oxidoreductase [Pseudomonadota bacterium]